MDQEFLFEQLATVQAVLNKAWPDLPLHVQSTFQQANDGLNTARSQLVSGKLYGAKWRIANAASRAGDYYIPQNPGWARELLELALALYESAESTNGNGQFEKSIDACRKKLQNLGQVESDPSLAEAFRQDEVPEAAPAEAAPETAAPAEVAAAEGAVAEEPADEVAAEDTEQPETVVPDEPDTPAASETAPETTLRPAYVPAAGPGKAFFGDGFSRIPPSTAGWSDLVDAWRGNADGETDIAKLVGGLETHIIDLLETYAPDSVAHLLPSLKDDLRSLVTQLDGITVPVDNRLVLHEEWAKPAHGTASEEMRSYQKTVDASKADALRSHWLTSALWNHNLRRLMPSNGYRTIADICGYIQTVQITHKHTDENRELLLAAAEATVLLAVHGLQETELAELHNVQNWMRHSVGIHLVVDGPDPTAPSKVRSDKRVRDFGGENWAAILLNSWRAAERQHKSVALALLRLCGWQTDRLARMFDFLAPASSPNLAKVADIAAWQKAAEDMLAAMRTVRVAKNPWEPGGSAATDSLKLSNRQLRGIAAEIAPHTSSVVLQGFAFGDRSVPTFLALDKFGPIGVLKIDEAGKVRREKENYDEFAEVLRPLYRPSKCTVSDTAITRNDGVRYRGIFTSYVFREPRQPRTLHAWIGEDIEDEVLRKVVNELFLKALVPWLSETQRNIGDLRDEYPAVRSPSFERHDFVPGKDAASELRKFEDSEDSAKVFGIKGGLPSHARTLGPVLAEAREGSRALGNSPLVRANDYSRVTNPLWLISHVAEVAPPPDSDDDRALVEWLLYDPEHGLTTRSYLTCVSHGDLHGDNILAGGHGTGRPELFIIDFETTHRGHICKDFARLESALWSRTFPWTDDQLVQLRTHFVDALHDEAFWEPRVPDDADPSVKRVLLCVAELRRILKGCEQNNWPLGVLEHKWALLASLIPFARYADHESPANRHLPFLLAADVAHAIVAEGERNLIDGAV